MGLKGYGLWAMGQLDSTCSAPHRQLVRPALGEAVEHVDEQVVQHVQHLQAGLALFTTLLLCVKTLCVKTRFN
jgi:hypothetical protein